MEEDATTVAVERAVSGSLSVLSLSDDITIEQDGHYNIDNEKRLPFDYKEVLGNGYSAVVQRVQHKKTKEMFAKKVIKFPNSRKAREEYEERYYNEAAIIRSLRTHSHVIRLFATYMTHTTPRSGGLLLQPAADEGDLQDYLDGYADLVEQTASRSADFERMTRVLEQAFGCLSSGLAYMHKKGIRHKDIKPGNILIHQGIVIYTDFGAAKDTTKDGQCTTEGAPDSLTRKYCAPEVLDYEKRNFAADVFSLGCVFIAILLRLSQKPDPEELEKKWYADIMDDVHKLLLSSDIPTKLSFLKCVIIDMTAREAFGRPASDKVADTICCNTGFSCSDCHYIRPKTPVVLQTHPEWNVQYSKWLLTRFDERYRHYYRVHYVEGIVSTSITFYDISLNNI
jgi:serine/threonine protein kinase